MKRLLCLLITANFLLGACAPKVEDMRLGGGTQDFGPHSKDVDLRDRLRQSENLIPDLSFKGPIATENFFRQANNLKRLSELTANPAFNAKGLAWIKKFYQTPQTTSYMQLANGPYAGLATAQTQQEVQNTLADIQTDIAKAKTNVRERILDLGSSFPWAAKRVRLEVLINEAQNFTDLVIMQIPLMGLTSQVEQGLREELVAQTKPYFADIRQFVDAFYRSRTFSNSLDLIRQVLVKFKVTLNTELQQNLTQGLQLAQEMETMSDPQGALTVLVDIWKMLTPDDRTRYFKSQNSELYDFFARQNDKDLACLRVPGCDGGLIDGITKKLFVLPKIKNFGVLKIQQLLNQATLNYLVTSVEDYGLTFVRDLPGIFADNIEAGLIKKAEELRDIQKNYGPFMKDLLAQWSFKKLPSYEGRIAGFEVSSINLDLSAKRPLQLQGNGSPAELKANTAATALMAKTQLMESLDSKDELGLQTALSQVNKLVAFSGYRDVNNKLITGLLSPVEAVKAPLDIMNLSAAKHSYRVPDRLTLSDSFHADPAMNYDKNFSAESFAEQIEGLSHMLTLTADWKISSYDRFLSKIMAQELTQDVQSPALRRSLFPKDMIFALNLGNVAVLLKDITKKATPVFLLSLDNHIIWADQYSSSNETSIMAGIVDIKNGQRSDTVKAKDVAKLLSAISQFLQATDGVEKTRSSIILEKDPVTQQTNLQALLDGRKDLKLLSVALANFISNQMVDESGLVQSQYSLKSLSRVAGTPVLVSEQVQVIRALMAAYKRTHIEAYLWSAQEIYYAMNKKLFDQNQRFYINGDGSKLDTPQVIATLVGLMEIKATLPQDSQLQLSKITQPWLTALSNLQN
ncbi:MAG: hypothetical protein J7501_03295 [Bdellovibrio sp.]|nr:hypothetical protein [Bdellovibrio sp.]